MNKTKGITICAILFVGLQLMGLIIFGFNGSFDLSWLLESLLMMALAILLATTYRSHSKNVMKPLIGATLMVVTGYEIDWAADYIQYFNDYATFYSKSYLVAYTVFQVVIAIAILLVSINHLVINMKHESNSKLVKVNKILYAVFALAIIGQLILYVYDMSDPAAIIGSIFATLSDIFLIAEVILIEGLVDDFRAEREAQN